MRRKDVPRQRGRRPKAEGDKCVTHNVSMPPDVSRALTALAEAQRMSVSLVVTTAVERYLDEARRRIAQAAAS